MKLACDVQTASLYCLAGREADVSTQEAKARPHSRVPRSDAHAQRPGDHQAQAPQGSQAAHAVSEGERGGRRKRGRLSRSGDFDRVYRDGRSHANRFLVVYAFPRGEGADGSNDTRLGISVSRKVGGAVERNAVKRALREAFWSLDPDVPSRHDFVLVARPDVAALLEREGTPGVARAIAGLMREAGLDERAV
jgi:ribonuclease P protein component